MVTSLTEFLLFSFSKLRFTEQMFRTFTVLVLPYSVKLCQSVYYLEQSTNVVFFSFVSLGDLYFSYVQKLI